MRLSDCFHVILTPTWTELENQTGPTLLCLTHVLSQGYGLFPNLSSGAQAETPSFIGKL